MTTDTWTWALTSGDDTGVHHPAADTAPLSARQAAILDLIADGHTDAEIARELWISEHTVKTHLMRAYGILGARNRAQAVAVALRKGLIP